MPLTNSSPISVSVSTNASQIASQRPLAAHARQTRVGWTLLGSLFLVIGIVGIYLPGVPTTGPLILASFLFGRGNPQLRDQMLQAPMLAAYRSYLDGSKPFTWTMRCWALGCMWLSIGISCWLMSYSSQMAVFALPACVLGGVAGTICILLYRSAACLPSTDR